MNIKILIDKNTLEVTSIDTDVTITEVLDSDNQIEIEISIPDKEQEYNQWQP